jgi:hypothetical protein
MKYQRTLLFTIGSLAAMAIASVTGAAQAADVTVDVYHHPRPVYVAPAPRVVVVTPAPHCTVRTARIWVGDHYAYRRVKRCH